MNHDLPAEKFIPVSRFALHDFLQQDTKEEEREIYLQFLKNLGAWRHEQFNRCLLELKSHYLPFSPDRDTLRVLEFTEEELQQKQEKLVSNLSSLLFDANYTRITPEDLNNIFTAQSPHGLQLKVDLSEFSQMLLFSRGLALETRKKRDWKSLFLKEKEYELATYQRLFLLLKLKPEQQRITEIMAAEEVDEEKAKKILKKLRGSLPENINSDHIYLKLFKRIPQIDLEMLFPNTQVQLKPFDKLKLGVTAGGGTVGSIMATATKITAAANPLSAAGALGGLAAVVFRQVTKFFTQRTKYMMLLAQRLYFHNLANNRGVLTLMVDRAEEEEIKESCLLYHFLLKRDSFTDDEVPAIKQEIEEKLQQQFGATIDFDIENPMAQLKKDKLVIADQNGTLKTLQPTKAQKHICKLRMDALNAMALSEDSAEMEEGI